MGMSMVKLLNNVKSNSCLGTLVSYAMPTFLARRISIVRPEPSGATIQKMTARWYFSFSQPAVPHSPLPHVHFEFASRSPPVNEYASSAASGPPRSPSPDPTHLRLVAVL
jgi:hypothetical protein